MSGIVGAVSGFATKQVNNVVSMFFGPTLSKLGYLELDVLVTENLSFPSEVTKYPIEDGSEISDHITEGNEELTITGSISQGTSYALQFSFCSSKMIDAVDTLRKLHTDRKTVTVITGLGTYEEMAFTALSFNRQSGDKGGNWLDINASLRKIKKVTLKEADLPEDSGGGSGSGGGGANGPGGRTGKTEVKKGASGTPSAEPRKSFLKQGADKYLPSAVGPIKFVPPK